MSSLRRVYVSVPGNHDVVIVDSRALTVITQIPAGNFPDGLAYAPQAHKVFVSDEMGGKEAVINTATNQLVESINMGGEVGNTQYDPDTGLIYANVQSLNELVAINPLTDQIVSRHKLKGGDRPHGFLIDAPDRLAFAACEEDNKLLVVDLKTFQVVQVFPVGNGPDVLAFDPIFKRFYVACEGDLISIFGLKGRRLEKLEDAEVGVNPHTISLDPKTHFIYLPLKNVKGRPVLRVMKEVDGDSPNEK